MTAERKFLITLVGVISAGIATIIVSVLNMPVVVRALPAVILVVLIGSVFVGGRRNRDTLEPAASALSNVHTSLDEDRFLEKPVRDVPLPSAVPDYGFEFSATVHWRLTRTRHSVELANPSGRAVDAIVHRACDVTRAELPNDFGLIRHRLETELAVALPDESGRIEAWAGNVALTLPDIDRSRLNRLASIRKDEEVWEHERNFERNKRAYLGEDVLKDTGSAVVWWLAKSDDVERTVGLIGLLARLSAAANNTEVPALFRDLDASTNDLIEKDGQDAYSRSFGPRLYGDASYPNGAPEAAYQAELSLAERFGTVMEHLNMDAAERSLFARHFATILTRFGRPEAATQVRRLFDPGYVEQPEASANEHEPGVADQTGGPGGSQAPGTKKPEDPNEWQ